jgi:hypothetical protein
MLSVYLFGSEVKLQGGRGEDKREVQNETTWDVGEERDMTYKQVHTAATAAAACAPKLL